jgi:hypothetical protein
MGVESFTLVNADTDEDIRILSDGDTINLATLPTTNLNIRANSNPEIVGSVQFVLNGVAYRTESTAPYALAGDSPVGNYLSWTPAKGNYALTSIPYSESRGNGEAGVSLSIDFMVTDE